MTMSTTENVKPATVRRKKCLPNEVSIFLVFLGIAALFEIAGWIVVGQSFLFNLHRLQIIILQVAVIGIIAVGVTLVIITGGIDLSSGSVVAMSAMIAATFAQSSMWPKVFYPRMTDLPFIPPLGGAGFSLELWQA